MELKDVILSTLAEMDETAVEADAGRSTAAPSVNTATSDSQENTHRELPRSTQDDRQLSDEAAYLESVKERLLVLFEGFQSPNNTQIEAKVDLTLNFLEYLLSTIDTRLDILKKRG